MTKTKSNPTTQIKDRRETYHDKMIAWGFKKIHPYVHQDDKDEILALVEKKRKERLKLIDQSR